MIRIVFNSDGTVTAGINSAGVFNKEIGRQLRSQLGELLDGHKRITIDLSGVNHIDSDGFGTLKDLFNVSIENNCDLHFTNVHDNISELVTNLSYTEEG